MKRWICAFLIFLVLAAPQQIYAAALSAECAALYDPLTETFLYEKNAGERRPMASTTKIMTALVALERYDPAQTVVIRPEWIGIEGSSMYLRAGEEVTVSDLLYGLMLQSGNDAAVALAGILSGSGEDFVALMNRRAAELGLADTSFTNPNGLDDAAHYTTAADLAVLAAAAMENEAFQTIVRTQSIQAAGRFMKNHNKLLALYPDACGIKTGYTRRSGRCLASAACREGRMLIAVTLAAPDDWNDHIALYEEAFSGLTRQALLQAGHLASVPAVSGTGERCGLYIREGFEMGLLAGEREKVTVTLYGPRMVYGPVQAGDRFGYAAVSLDGRELFRTEVYYEKDVQKPAADQGFWRRLLDRVMGM